MKASFSNTRVNTLAPSMVAATVAPRVPVSVFRGSRRRRVVSPCSNKSTFRRKIALKWTKKWTLQRTSARAPQLVKVIQSHRAAFAAGRTASAPGAGRPGAARALDLRPLSLFVDSQPSGMHVRRNARALERARGQGSGSALYAHHLCHLQRAESWPCSASCCATCSSPALCLCSRMSALSRG